MTQEQTGAAASCATLAELLRMRAQASCRPWDIKLLYQQGQLPPELAPMGDDLAVSLTYADLLRFSERAAAKLQSIGVAKGDRVLVVLPTGVGWLASFFGCQLLGAIPVPLVPPWSVDHLLLQVGRMAEVVRVCEASALVIEESLVSVLAATQAPAVEPLRALPRLAALDLLTERRNPSFALCSPDSDAPAFIQFTSGSTAEPKGVVISQRAVLANCSFIGERLGIQAQDVGCSWLPLFHDMGLIGHVLVPLCFGTKSVLLPPEVFARQPRAWLEVCSRYQATIITAPNSAYDLCANKVSDRDLARLDLSQIRIAMCGAEPILPSTLRRFATRFAGVGFRDSSLTPVYGLAEATLAVTLAGSSPRIDRFDRDALQQHGRAVPVASDTSSSGSIELVGVGRPATALALKIVDDAGKSLGERQVGLIEVSGPSLMTEYFRNPAATKRVLQDGFVRTGDLGFIAEGELFIVGRSKETIIKGGRNLHPYDVEAAAAAVDGIRKGRVAAFGVQNLQTGTEDVVLACETKVTDPALRKRLERAVKVAVYAATSVTLDVLQLVPPGALPKTSSGKMQRALVRERFQAGTLRATRASWALRARALWALKWSQLRGNRAKER